MRQAIGIDVGGTTIKAGLVSPRGTLTHHLSFPTPRTKQAIIKKIHSIVKDLTNHSIIGVGIGLPGPFRKNGTLGNVPNLPLSGLNPNQFKKLHKSVQVENDATCALLGELATTSANRIIMLTLGTGVGGAISLHGHLLRGAGSELGHMIIDKDGPTLRCGHKGCLESLVSAQALMRNNSDVTTLARQAHAGNVKALRVFATMGTNLGIGIANLCNIFAPDLVILGGSVSDAFPYFKTTMRDTMKRNTYYPTKIIKKKSPHAGIIGAGLLIHRNS